ncbi:MAG: aminopeptidase P N-terminal domain-containing protein [Planctomycetes bacterium]|jgi:Xaa-Pro aminopeptidase|nr:aminopeptidase P N-terminal domain-containing protein [Planctomycetota bacterium]MCL4729165.1 aminopeptidase P N-terminal domain-containing protein [Planctomycetota bacterium]
MAYEFDPAVFKRRRDRLLAEMQPGVAIFPAAPEYLRNGDVHHDYRQHSDFFYLTGFEEPGALALLCKDAGEHRFVLFVPKRDKLMEIWNGRRAGPEGAKARYGADAAFTLEEIDQKVPDYLRNVQRLYVRLGENTAFDERVTGWLNRVRAMKRQGYNAPTELHDPARILHEMRLIKNDDDLRYMRQACRITAEAHNHGMRMTRPGMREYEVQAEIEYIFRKNGCHRNGYGSIVAAGDNANILHYHENNALLRDGDLILVDAGSEYGFYSADITRTWPVNGKFSEPQAEVYNWVLKAQLEAIKLCRPGVSYRDAHNRAVEVLTEGMVAMGLLSGDPKEIIATQNQWDEDVKNKKKDPAKDKAPRTYREFYMHNTSHWLGMDVHDVGDYKNGDNWVPLRPGCVLTIEPGLYIAADRDDVPNKYRGIGVRIEDDVLVTTGQPDVLTKDAVKTVEDIEALMEEAKALK